MEISRSFALRLQKQGRGVKTNVFAVNNRVFIGYIYPRYGWPCHSMYLANKAEKSEFQATMERIKKSRASAAKFE